MVNYENIIEFNNIFFKAIGFLFLIHYCYSEPIQKNLRLKRQPPVANELTVNGLIENAVRNVFRANGFVAATTVGAELDRQQVLIDELIANLGANNNRLLLSLNEFSRFIFGPQFVPQVNNFATQLQRLQTISNFINTGLTQANNLCNQATANPNAACQTSLTARTNLVQPIINRIRNEQASNFDLQSFLNGNNRQFPQGNRNLPRNPNDIFQDLVDFLNQRLP